ncbi:MAG TPA: sigma-70 family RNA polymerase sigma factor [Thermoanaerobaculia bacterium]|nr:sigma-70 family RNA polymerase sigma factor [Thermoanaerobaculia bacterium]
MDISTQTRSEGSEARLLERLRGGDSRAFETLVRTHTPILLRVARRFMRSEEDARDAVQDAFVSMFKALGGFESNARLSTWLHRILINACLMKLRTRRRHPEEDIEEYLPRFRDDGHQLESSVPWAESAETILELRELSNLVQRSIDQLPDTYRVVLLLRDIEELTTEEAAQILGVTPNAVKIRLHRGRQALRTLLDPHIRSVE